MEQIDGPARTSSPSCEQRDAGREGQGDADSRKRGDMGRPRIKLPQRSDMICGFASLKGQRICKFVIFAILGCNSFFQCVKTKSYENINEAVENPCNYYNTQIFYAEATFQPARKQTYFVLSSCRQKTVN